MVWYGDDNTGALVDGEYEIFGQRLTGTAASLFASVLPSSRSVQVGNIASAFATLINASSAATAGCGFSPIPSLPALFHFQHTNCANNLPLGTQDAPIAIDALSAGCFVFLLQPTNTITPTDVGFTFSCFDALAAPTFVGLDTLLLSASTSPTPDIVALGATLCNNGIVNIPTPMGTGVFSVATVNLGSSADITVTADTGGVSLPLTPFVCETNPTTAQCISAIGLSVTTMIAAGATPTFSFFVQGAGNVPFDPAFNRIFVRFKQGPVVRGSTNVAVRTHTENCTVQ